MISILYMIFVIFLLDINNSIPSIKSDSFEIIWKSDKTICKKDIKGDEKNLYETDKDYISYRGVHISPNNKYIAVIETTEGYTPPEKYDYEILPKNSLVIIDTNGTVYYKIDDNVRKLSWSPDGTKLAYITGEYREEGLGFKSTGVFLFDLINGNKITVTKDFPHPSIKNYTGAGYDINWAVHDSNIYIKEYDKAGGNYVYDTKTRTTHQVPYKGIHFSPDGKYYIAINPEDDTYIYETATNQDISDEVKLAINSIPISWLPDREHHLQVVKLLYSDTLKYDSVRIVVDNRKIRGKRYIIYDVDKRVIVKEWVEEQ
ncbi:MAG: hypothetical protein PHU88_01615 [candidate division Zixibacteria bacterium]|nr:hypothetical protein [candidate division Zixibacteria bacterium]MDD5426068.1 hypothetical protein [candidate division Zixibacteria bacterium]